MPKLNSMFKKTTYITLSNRRQSIRQDAMVTEKELEPALSGEQPNVPEGLWKSVRNAARFFTTKIWKKSLCVPGMPPSSADFGSDTYQPDCRCGKL